jgi:hypothetical protein
LPRPNSPLCCVIATHIPGRSFFARSVSAICIPDAALVPARLSTVGWPGLGVAMLLPTPVLPLPATEISLLKPTPTRNCLKKLQRLSD